MYTLIHIDDNRPNELILQDHKVEWDSREVVDDFGTLGKGFLHLGIVIAGVELVLKEEMWELGFLPDLSIEWAALALDGLDGSAEELLDLARGEEVQ